MATPLSASAPGRPRRLAARLGVGAVTVLTGLLLSQQALASDDETSFSGTLHRGKVHSYVHYFGEESGDTLAWYFDNRSPAGKAILATCRPARPCHVTATTTSDKTKPADIPETTSGSWRVLSVTKVSRKAPD